LFENALIFRDIFAIIYKACSLTAHFKKNLSTFVVSSQQCRTCS